MTDTTTDDEPDELSLTEFIEQLRRTPPRKGFPRKTFEELMVEQGVGPVDVEKMKALAPEPFYEGFEEDIRRMRRGLDPLGPRT